MYVAKTPSFIKPLARHLTWSIPVDEKKIFLTFDDGPTPGVTEEVLRLLRMHNAKATFFCLGKNVRNHPELYNKIITEGHTTGNHSEHHPDGWKTGHRQYLRDIMLATEVIKSSLFRPPYGHITLHQSRSLRSRFQIIMWDVLSGDFDPHSTPEMCAERVLRHAQPGSIVVMHDSVKASQNMLGSLPHILKTMSDRGYKFAALKDDVSQHVSSGYL